VVCSDALHFTRHASLPSLFKYMDTVVKRGNVQEVLPAIQQIELDVGLVLCLWDSLTRFL
jgi:hypothetical protein